MEFLVLGSLEVLCGSDKVPLGSAKQRLLLAALLVEANRVVSVDRLADVLWGDDQPGDATATLQTYVSRLRGALEPGDSAATQQGVLVTRAPGYLLHADRDQVDAARFEDLLSDGQARLTAGEPAAAATTFGQALALWRGRAYAEFADDEFARTEAIRLDELRRVAIDVRVEAQLSLGAHAELVGELEGIVASDLLRERPRAQLMLALYRCGREAEALRSYQQYRRYLGDELGVEPSTVLQRLEDEILHQSPDLDWVPTDPAPIDRVAPRGVDPRGASVSTPVPAVERSDAEAVRRGRSDDLGAPGSTTITFFFTDLESSTRLWEAHPDAMRSALARHDVILREAVAGHGGEVVKTTGDGVHAVFGDASDAVSAAVAAQRSFDAEPWPDTGPLQIRIGLHSGRAEHRDADYFGVEVNRAARLMAVAHGGQVLASLATKELAADAVPIGVGFLDLGEHGLQDLTRPERVFQILAPGLPSVFPPCRSSEGVTTNLPHPVTSFVGREHELEAVTAAVREARLVTITGVGGVGKTRLALEVAGVVASTYPDGVWLCELSAATNADELAQIVVAALPGRVRPGLTLEDTIAEFLAAKRLLLMLDNCEHLLETAGHLASVILRRCSEIEILATSREALGVEGEQAWPLRSLALPESADTEAVASSAAVRLFEDRARAARPGFVVDASNAEVVGALCHHVDGIPLAIELAAARVMAMSPREILDHLDQRFQLLTGRRAGEERHQTMRRTLEWSYSLLEPTERLVFDCLGAFTGSFDATAASAVIAGEDLGEWDVLDALSKLVAKSMLTAEADPRGTTRFQLLETLRHYARERLQEAGDISRWRRRHGEFYAGFAERAGPGLEGPDELVWRRKIRAELDNLRAAVAWALDTGPGGDTELAVRIVASLAYQVASDLSAGVGVWAERTVPQVEGSLPRRRAAVLAAAAWNAYARGDFEAAKRLALDVVDGGPPADSLVPMLPYACASLVDVQGGRPDQALQRMVEAKQTVDAGGAPLRERADVRSFAAFCAVTAGQLAQASALVDEAIPLARESGSPSAQAHALAILGHVLQDEDPDAALIALEESVTLSRAGASDFALTAALHKAAQLTARGGDAGRALAELRDAVAHDHQRGSRPSLLYTLNIGVEVLAELGHTELASVLVGIVTAGPLAPLVADRIETREMARLEPILERLRADLGRDRYDAAMARGAGLSYDELVAYTLGELERIADSRPPS